MAKETQIHNYAVEPDKETLKQFKTCYEHSWVKKAALMPDAHRGYVAPIGAVLATKDYIVPSWVGYDIGCGMTTATLKAEELLHTIEEKKETIYEEVKRTIPMGLGKIHKTEEAVSNKTKKEYKKLLQEYKQKPHNKKLLDHIQNKAIKHLGTLGHGNHFIELGKDEENNLWLTIHSGSRGIGHEIAKQYMQTSANNKKIYEETHPLDLRTDIGKEYKHIQEFALKYALLNRKEILTQTIKAIESATGINIEYEIWANKNHNHAIQEKGYTIHRKGATPAKKKEKGIIPANMKDGCYLVEGKGNTKFLNSSSHGAGRTLGRKEAQTKISMKEFKESMKGIQGTINKHTKDEAPQAYKNINKVLEAQKESIKILKHIQPIINWKGTKRTKEQKKEEHH